MGRAQIKKKSTFIDMTAMSDVTVLLLTFFMLTSTFVKKEPVQVTTPASVSEIKIPETNVLQILVDPEGKIFMSLDKQQDMQAVLESMGEEYGIKFTPEQEKRFMLSSTFGVPIRSMQKYLDLPKINGIRSLRMKVFHAIVLIISLNRGYVMHVLLTLIYVLPSRQTLRLHTQ